MAPGSKARATATRQAAHQRLADGLNALVLEARDIDVSADPPQLHASEGDT
jgi:hypothetical protein